jgi:Protein of unknown function (DUF2853)
MYFGIHHQEFGINLAEQPGETSAMKIDYVPDMKKYAPNADEKAIKAIIKHLGIALHGTDSSGVACSSKSECDTVREQWLKKKLKLTQPDAELDKAIVDVCTAMKTEKHKHRVVFYYLLADKFGKVASL